MSWHINCLKHIFVIEAHTESERNQECEETTDSSRL